MTGNKDKNKSIKKRKPRVLLSKNERVHAYQYGDNLELVTSPNLVPPVTRIDAEHYVDANGEIKDYQKSTNKSENVASVAKTMKRLRRLIVNNFDGGDDQLWLTLTYAENMRDVKRLYGDFKNFIKVLRRHYGHLEYISVIEPQARGAWHCHVLLKTDDGSELYIENADLARIWGKGFTKVKRLRESDNVAAYVMAYLSNMPVSEVTGNPKDKTIVKGQRLHFYPSGMQFYRFSRGITLPPEIKTSKSEVQELYSVSDSDLVFSNRREFTLTKAIGEDIDAVFNTEIYRLGDNKDGG